MLPLLTATAIFFVGTALAGSPVSLPQELIIYNTFMGFKVRNILLCIQHELSCHISAFGLKCPEIEICLWTLVVLNENIICLYN
jgi:hypothetical protein